MEALASPDTSLLVECNCKFCHRKLLDAPPGLYINTMCQNCKGGLGKGREDFEDFVLIQIIIYLTKHPILAAWCFLCSLVINCYR